MQCNTTEFHITKINFQNETGHSRHFTDASCMRCQTPSATEGKICNISVKKNFTSPWKQALSPVACAQPDK
jgi:hypothetical protein